MKLVRLQGWSGLSWCFLLHTNRERSKCINLLVIVHDLCPLKYCDWWNLQGTSFLPWTSLVPRSHPVHPQRRVWCYKSKTLAIAPEAWSGQRNCWAALSIIPLKSGIIHCKNISTIFRSSYACCVRNTLQNFKGMLPGADVPRLPRSGTQTLKLCRRVEPGIFSHMRSG